MEESTRPKVNLYIESTYRGPARKSGRAIYLLEFVKPDGTPFTRWDIIEFDSATENQAELTAIVAALKRIKQPCSIRIYTQCLHIFNAITNGWHRVWVQNNMHNAKGKPVKNAELWMEMLAELDRHRFVITGESHEYRSWMISELGGEHGKEHH